ncbi:septal ring lytic transglycosylase RlpA family protein [Desertivirga xinjiangensis]|uniref:septal ring lytic transglycosylase RlpA family protein n=1 Tax=Desertivirga xinjiangensis TaxID=539206 RepID=UPI00210D09B8|nr:LysM peptidoglycan-binding domain-containing protein [Pedobacter xinjiangensis]
MTNGDYSKMRSILAVLCTIFTLQASAYSNRIDSVGVENSNGNQVIVHKVAPKESYYSIGRLYSVPPKDIIALNNNIPLQIGILLKVPTQRPFSTPKSENKSRQQSDAESKTEPLGDYTVQPKETLYRIAQKFNTTIEEIRRLNNLRSNSLSVGQVLKVPGGTTATYTQNPVAAAIGNSVVNSSVGDTFHVERPKIATSRLGVTERSERGVAVWIADENLDATKMLALHRTAPVGTVIKITNPMTDRTTFAKVVGKFTENETTKDVIIVLTKATADLLGALDKRFQVNIDYGMPNE